MIEITWTVKYITEFIATAFLIILGNGAVANVDLKGTKGNNSGWIIIAIGYGLGVMMPALMFVMSLETILTQLSHLDWHFQVFSLGHTLDNTFLHKFWEQCLDS